LRQLIWRPRTADPGRKRAGRLRAASGWWLAALVGFACTRVYATRPESLRMLYAVNEASGDRGTISVYNIGAGHRLVRTIRTVPGVEDVRGVAGSAATGRLYVAYYGASGSGMIYCLDLYRDTVVWNKAIPDGVDRLASSPDGRLIYVPTWEAGSANYIQVLDGPTGNVVRRVYFSERSHDTQYPLSGPIFQETKADDGSGKYLYLIDPRTYAVSRAGPFSGVVGPYTVDSLSRYVVANVTGIWGMQVYDLNTRRSVTATIPHHPPGSAGLLHGIAWTPDQQEVWQSGPRDDPHVYIWDMLKPMGPVLKDRVTLKSGHGSHWLTFDIRGDYVYVAPEKGSYDGTEIFNASTRSFVGAIAASEDMLEIDFIDGRVTQMGDQYGIGRR
jgi:hypothetical protein